MKTKFLKWDVTLQKVLVAFNVILTCIPPLWFFLLMLQFIEGCYQLLSSFINVQLHHKSMGFEKYRRIHLIGSIAYLIVLAAFSAVVDRIPEFIAKALVFLVIVMIPQAIFYGYFWLCKKELEYLERREFHILK